MSFCHILQMMLPALPPYHALASLDHIDPHNIAPDRGLNLQYNCAKVNQSAPLVHAPLSGIVEICQDPLLLAQNAFGIRDQHGNLHRFHHLQSLFLHAGEQAYFGQAMGTLGGAGINGPHHYAPHLHYALQDAQGQYLDPRSWWRQMYAVVMQHCAATSPFNWQQRRLRIAPPAPALFEAWPTEASLYAALNLSDSGHAANQTSQMHKPAQRYA